MSEPYIRERECTAYSVISENRRRNGDSTGLPGSEEGELTATKSTVLLEARSGFEPLNKGFADLCLTTWLPRLIVRTFRYYTFEWERGAPGPDPQEWHRQARNGSPSPSSAARFAVEGVRRTARFLRPSKPARTPTTASSQNNPPSPSIPHAVADLAEASRLAAIAEDSNRRPAQQLIEDNQAGTGTTKTSWNLSSSNGRLYAH